MDEVRQKMINLMYLVFILLTFIYTPREFLNSSGYVALSFEELGKNYKEQTQDGDKYFKDSIYIGTPLYYEYLQIREISKSIDLTGRFIDSLLVATDGQNGINASNTSLPKKVLIKSGAGDSLFRAVNNILTGIDALGIVGLSHLTDTVLPYLNTIYGASGRSYSWDRFFFYNIPWGVAKINLLKIKCDLTFAQYKLKRYLHDNLAAPSPPEILEFTSPVLDFAIHESSNFTIGSKITFELNNYSSDNYKNTEVLVFKDGRLYKKLPVSPQGQVNFVPELSGKYKMVVRAQGREVSKEFTVYDIKIEVFKNFANQLFYVGMDNPLELKDPGGAVSLRFELNRGELYVKPEKLILRFEQEGAAHLKVYSLREGTEVLIDEKKFLVQRLPPPVVKIDDKAGGEISHKLLKLQTEITLSSFGHRESPYQIARYDIVCIGKFSNQTLTNYAQEFSIETRRKLQTLQSGDLFIVDNIRLLDSDKSLITVPSLVFKVK